MCYFFRLIACVNVDRPNLDNISDHWKYSIFSPFFFWGMGGLLVRIHSTNTIQHTGRYFYASATAVAGGIMFLGCPSVRLSIKRPETWSTTLAESKKVRASGKKWQLKDIMCNISAWLDLCYIFLLSCVLPSQMFVTRSNPEKYVLFFNWMVRFAWSPVIGAISPLTPSSCSDYRGNTRSYKLFWDCFDNRYRHDWISHITYCKLQ